MIYYFPRFRSDDNDFEDFGGFEVRADDIRTNGVTLSFLRFYNKNNVNRISYPHRIKP
jgi:hypothetical protein